MTPDEMQWQRHVDRHIRDRAERQKRAALRGRAACRPRADVRADVGRGWRRVRCERAQAGFPGCRSGGSGRSIGRV